MGKHRQEDDGCEARECGIEFFDHDTPYERAIKERAYFAYMEAEGRPFTAGERRVYDLLKRAEQLRAELADVQAVLAGTANSGACLHKTYCAFLRAGGSTAGEFSKFICFGIAPRRGAGPRLVVSNADRKKPGGLPRRMLRKLPTA